MYYIAEIIEVGFLSLPFDDDPAEIDVSRRQCDERDDTERLVPE